MEHLLNVYASKAAKGSIADFVGYIEVDDEHATMKLTQGVWLVSDPVHTTAHSATQLGVRHGLSWCISTWPVHCRCGDIKAAGP